MKRLAGLAALLAVGAGLGTYFGLRGPSLPEVPKAKRSAILEEAKAEGIIRGYRVLRFQPQYGNWKYGVVGGEIDLRLSTCGDSAGCPPGYQPHLFIEYRHTAAAQASAILRVAQAQMPRAKIIFGPPYYP